MSTQTNVSVTIVDRAMPVFAEVLYSVSVPENLPLYATVVTVTANSPTSASLVYSIIDGNDLGQFSVDFSVGKSTFTCIFVGKKHICLHCLMTDFCKSSLTCSN